jgi:hypothetical protein
MRRTGPALVLALTALAPAGCKSCGRPPAPVPCAPVVLPPAAQAETPPPPLVPTSAAYPPR